MRYRQAEGVTGRHGEASAAVKDDFRRAIHGCSHHRPRGGERLNSSEWQTLKKGRQNSDIGQAKPSRDIVLVPDETNGVGEAQFPDLLLELSTRGHHRPRTPVGR